MRCRKCDSEHESKDYFATTKLCKECFDQLSQEERDRVLAEAENYVCDSCGNVLWFLREATS